MADTAQRPGERVPPQAVDMEKMVLGAILLEEDAISLVLELLSETDFYPEKHRKIYRALLNLFERSEPRDLVTLRQELFKMKVLEQVGGEYYLSTLVNDVTSAAHVTTYAKIVLEKSMFRQLITTSTQILNDSYEATEDAGAVVDKAEQKIFSLAEKRMQTGFRPLTDFLKPVFEAIESAQERGGGILGVPTGYAKLDELTSGFQKSDLVIVAGRPSMGKTSFAMNVARNAAVDHGKSVGVFSLEMSSQQLTHRLLCSEARLNAHLVRTGRLHTDEWQRLALHVGALEEAKIFIDDTPGLTPLDLRAKARRLKTEKGIDMIVIDYLQLMSYHTKTDNRQQEISSISRALKALAKEIDVPVVALSQLSRGVESRDDKRPQLSDLRDSGAIEQDADVVLFIYRPEFYERDEDKKEELSGKAEVIIGKQRNGPIDIVPMTFIKEYARFEDPAPNYQDDNYSDQNAAHDDYADEDTFG